MTATLLTLVAVEIPGWAAAIGGALALPLTGWIVVAGRRAQRQDSDGHMLDRAADAVQRHETTDATMAQAIDSLTAVVGKMDTKLDRLGADMTAAKVERAEDRTRAEADRERLARIEAWLDAQDARITRVDEAHIAGRHALRGEIQGWVSTGIGDALEILRALIPSTPARPSRPSRRG